jgi:H+/gluconate symporter-like permease
MGLLGILIGLSLLIWLAFRGWSVLLLAPAAALRPATVGQLDANLHGQRRNVSGAILSTVSTRRCLRQAHGGFGFGHRRRALHDGEARQKPRHARARPGILAAIIMLGFGLWWLHRAEQTARRRGEGFGADTSARPDAAADDERVRERATTAREFDPAEIHRGHQSDTAPSIFVAALPLGVVIAVNLAMSLFVLPHLDSSFLSEERFGSTSITAVAGVWSVVVALAAAIVVVVVSNRGRLPLLRQSVDAGANASSLPALSVASLVGFGAVFADLPAFAVVRDWL